MDLFVLVCMVAMAAHAAALDNGLARTPPMGWMSWVRFQCNTDCARNPSICISENLYMEMADRMVADGYKDAGYEYVSIDDCWSSKIRDPITNKLQADADRFPHGIKALADYVHAKGLKLGIYADIGSKTCAGYPGSQSTMQLDARTFAEWEVDSLKLDGCNSDPKLFDSLYPQMAQFLNETGRPILFACEWPLYQRVAGISPNYSQIADYCNTWRNYNDVFVTWASIMSIINFYGGDQGGFSHASGPGGFSDPDQIVIGNPGLSASQQQVQMAMWAVLAAPLFVSSDLRDIDPVSRDIILNKGAIEINQDPLGIMGTRVLQGSHVEVWARPVLPTGSYAIAVLNLRDGGNKIPVTFSLSQLVPGVTGTYSVTDVFTGAYVRTVSWSQQVTEWAENSSVVFRKYTALT